MNGHDLPVIHRSGNDVTILTYGTLLDNALKAAEILSSQGVEATVLRLLNLSELNVDSIISRISGDRVFVMEEVSGGCGIAAALALELGEKAPHITVYSRDLGLEFVPHGAVNRLYERCGLDEKSIAEYVQEVLKDEN